MKALPQQILQSIYGQYMRIWDTSIDNQYLGEWIILKQHCNINVKFVYLCIQNRMNVETTKAFNNKQAEYFLIHLSLHSPIMKKRKKAWRPNSAQSKYTKSKLP